MPTENRFCSTEMVSVTRYLAEEINAALINHGHVALPRRLQEAMNAPCPQPHPEPIAWMVGTAIWWTKEEAERDAVAVGLPVIAVGPIANPEEVQRLVAANTEYARRHLDLNGEVERLRAALKFYADREHYHFESGNWDTVSGEPLNILWRGEEPDFIEDGTVARNALFASAEPSAPTFADAIKNPPEWVGKHLASKAEPSAPAKLGPWLPLSAPGQIQEGDWLCFTVSGSFICAQARLIICPGTDKEEIVYNRKKNHYFCTDMAIAGTSNHKGVLIARAALERKPS